VNDASRLTCVEAPPDEKKESATAFLARALDWFVARSNRVERVMTDTGSCYRSTLFGKALSACDIRHIRTRPFTSRINGKAERFVQTLQREWAYGASHPSSQARNRDLPRWLDWFNTMRPHSIPNGQAPRATH